MEHYGTPWIFTIVGFAFHSLRFISQSSLDYCNSFIVKIPLFWRLTPCRWVIGLRLFDKKAKSSFARIGNSNIAAKILNKRVIVVLPSHSGHMPGWCLK